MADPAHREFEEPTLSPPPAVPVAVLWRGAVLLGSSLVIGAMLVAHQKKHVARRSAARGRRGGCLGTAHSRRGYSGGRLYESSTADFSGHSGGDGNTGDAHLQTGVRNHVREDLWAIIPFPDS